MNLAVLNGLDNAAFVSALAGIYEHSPWIPDGAFAARPFANVAALQKDLAAVVQAASEEAKLGLIRAHPDLAGKFGIANPLTEHSAAEQSSVGLDRLSEQEFAEFQRLNNAYRQRFDFPFIICVRRHTKDSILREFERRVERDKAEEVVAALHEIARIAALRLGQTFVDDGSLKTAGRLSTHVLDTQAGRPAQGMRYELFELSRHGPPRLLAGGVTNADGRTDAPLIAGRPVPIGTYELQFSVAEHFARNRVVQADPPFLDVVPLRFSVAEPEGHYHVPLLVTPWSFSTYRGS